MRDEEWYALHAAIDILSTLADGKKIKGKGKLHRKNLAKHSVTLRQMLHKLENPKPSIWEDFSQIFEKAGM